MGNQMTKIQPSKHEYFSSYGSFSRNGQEFLICQRMVQHRKIRQAWQNLVVELRNIPNDHIMVPQDWSVVQNALCGNGEVVEIQYQNYGGNLEELIIERGTSNKHFEESQIWYVLYALAEVGLNCRSLGQRVGDIRPRNILMNQKGQIKVLTFLSFPNDIVPYTQKSSQIFFSPEELLQRKKGYMNSSCDTVQSESFSIGLTILSMILLQDMSQLYDYPSNQLLQKSLEKEIAKIQDTTYHSLNEERNFSYSPGLHRAIKLLLALDPQQRLGFTLLYRQLEPYLQQIEEFQPFEVNLEVTQEQKGEVQKQEKEDNKTQKDVIMLRSRKRKVRVQTLQTIDKKESGQRMLPVSQAPIVQSRYLTLDHPPRQTNPLFYLGNNSLLESIDQKLKKSREEFPS